MYFRAPSRGPALDHGSPETDVFAKELGARRRIGVAPSGEQGSPIRRFSRSPTRQFLTPLQGSDHYPKRHHPGVIETDAAISENPRPANLALLIAEESKGLIHGCYNSGH
jgi:hypothetical protein